MPNKANPDFLGKRPVGALLWEFSFPSIVAAFVSASYNNVARIFVGQKIGALGIAALQVSDPFMLLAQAVAMMITTGASTLFRSSWGRKITIRPRRFSGRPCDVPGRLGVFRVRAPLEPMLILFGASEEIFLGQRIPFHYHLGVVFQEISYGVNNFIRSRGNRGSR